MPTYRYLVHGRVQGVGFRYFVLRQAEALGLTGFARNRADGSVEVVAEGSEQALANLEAKLRVGPSFSEVIQVERETVPSRGDGSFHIR